MTEGVDAFIQSDLRPAETICKFIIMLSGKKKLALKNTYAKVFTWNKVNYDYVNYVSKMRLKFSYLVIVKIKPQEIQINFVFNLI